MYVLLLLLNICAMKIEGKAGHQEKIMGYKVNISFLMLFLFQFFCFPSQLSNNRKGESYYIILHYSCMLLVLSSSSPPSSHVQYYYCMYTYARVKCNEIFPHRQQTRQTHKKSKNEKRITRILSKGKLFGYVHAYKVFNFF